MRLLIFFLCTLGFVNAQVVRNRAHNHYSENLPILDEQKGDIEAVFACDVISYVGIDYSNFNYFSEDTTYNLASFKAYWTSEFEKSVVGGDFKILKKNLLKKFSSCSVELSPSDSVLCRTEFDTLVYPMEKCRIEEVIMTYKMNNCQPIGLVIMPEKFDVINQKAIINFVFFDTFTREIVWYLEMQSRFNRFDVKRNWTKEMREIFFEFRSQYHQRRRKYK